MKQCNVKNTLIIIYLSLLIPNIFSFFLVLYSPYKSFFSTYGALGYISLYLLIVGVILYIASHLIDMKKKIRNIDISDFVSNKILIILVLFLFLGIILHLYDKISIRGYDYFSETARNIRQEWLNDGRQRDSIASSWQSAFGYLFSFLYFVVMYLTIVSNLKISNTVKYIIVFIASMIIIILSYTIGSRSIILFSAVFILSLYILLFLYDEHKLKFSFIIPILISFIFYIFFITYVQIYGNNKNINFNAYMAGYNKELHIKETNIKETNIKETNIKETNIKETKGDKIQNVFSLAILYANSGVYNFEFTLHQKEHPGTVLLSSIRSILKRFHIINDIQYIPKTYGKGMISAFGAVWYDLGTIGFILFASLHSLLFIMIAMGLTNANILTNLLSRMSFSFFIILNIFSPLVLATNLIIAPGLILSYIILFLIILINLKLKNFKKGQKCQRIKILF